MNLLKIEKISHGKSKNKFLLKEFVWKNKNLVYAIYIGIIAFIIFWKRFSKLTFLVFEKLWNFFQR